MLIELNLVRGLGHGTPLSTKGDDALGKVAPFMLEAGVSSSLEIARFWGIDMATERPALVLTAGDAVAKPTVSADSEGGHLGQVVMNAVCATPSGVQEIIAKALRAAGLLK